MDTGGATQAGPGPGGNSTYWLHRRPNTRRSSRGNSTVWRLQSISGRMGSGKSSIICLWAQWKVVPLEGAHWCARPMCARDGASLRQTWPRGSGSCSGWGVSMSSRRLIVSCGVQPAFVLVGAAGDNLGVHHQGVRSAGVE